MTGILRLPLVPLLSLTWASAQHGTHMWLASIDWNSHTHCFRKDSVLPRTMAQDDSWSESSDQTALSLFIWIEFICSLQWGRNHVVKAVCQRYIQFSVLKSIRYAHSGAICVQESARVRTENFFLKDSTKDMRNWHPFNFVFFILQDLFILGRVKGRWQPCWCRPEWLHVICTAQ